MDHLSKTIKIFIFASIILISLTMHFPNFSKDLLSMHVWRQSLTQSTILSFYEEDFNILNPHHADRGNEDGIHRMEFPLMQWLIAGFYKMFGNHLIITRIFTFVVGLFSVVGIYKLLSAIFRNDLLALIGAWAFNFSPSFYYYTINPLPDNFALCCSIWGLAFFFSWVKDQHRSSLVLSGIFLCIGSLCKLPFILYYSVPLTHLFLEFLEQKERRKGVLVQAVVVTFLIILPIVWYASVVPTWKGNGIVTGLLVNNTPFSETLGYFRYIVISTLPELLINYGSVIFFLSGFYFLYRKEIYKDRRFIVFIIWSLAVSAYYFFEINLIGFVHDYYLFPFYPLLFILVSYGAYSLLNTHNRFFKYLTFSLLLLLPLTAHLRTLNRWNPEKPGFNKDLLTYKNDLRNAVPKEALCIVGDDNSHAIYFYYVDKKGWAFDKILTKQQMSEMVKKGAEYLYSDSRSVDENTDLKSFLDTLVMERGTIKVYRLKKD